MVFSSYLINYTLYFSNFDDRFGILLPYTSTKRYSLNYIETIIDLSLNFGKFFFFEFRFQRILLFQSLISTNSSFSIFNFDEMFNSCFELRYRWVSKDVISFRWLKYHFYWKSHSNLKFDFYNLIVCCNIIKHDSVLDRTIVEVFWAHNLS